MRDSPALDIIPKLQEVGFKISAFDPIAMKEAKSLLNNIVFSENIEDV